MKKDIIYKRIKGVSSEINFELPNMKYPMTKGLISIMIPIYNYEKNIHELLENILAQTFTNWEAILVNDGSQDNTKLILDEFAKKDNRFIVIHKKNEGQFFLTMKTALENTKGEYIIEIDQDDKIDPFYLEKMYKKITETDSDFVYCNYHYPGHNGKDLSNANAENYIWYADKDKNIQFCLENIGNCDILFNKMIKRDIFTKVKFPISNHISFFGDTIIMFQVIYNSKTIAYVPEHLYYHSIGGLSTVFTSKFLVLKLLGFVVYFKTIRHIFETQKGNIPENLIESLCAKMAIGGNMPASYYYLNKKSRDLIKNDIEPFILESIKREKRWYLKIFYKLASKGIIFPFWFAIRLLLVTNIKIKKSSKV